MGSQYIIRPEPNNKYIVSKWEDRSLPTAIYTVEPGYRGFLECDCPARGICKHIKLVVRFIRGDRRLVYDYSQTFEKGPNFPFIKT